MSGVTSRVFQHASLAERRQSFRISPPQGLVKEMGLWFMPACPEPTLPLADLGPPHLLSMHCDPKVTLQDISAVGMRFSIAKAHLPPVGQLKSGHCYVYLKLATPLPGKSTLRCLLVGMRILGLTSTDTGVNMRGQIMTRAKPAGASKSFALFRVDRVGIKEISVWSDEILRMGRGLLPSIACSMDMDNLMVEIFMHLTELQQQAELERQAELKHQAEQERQAELRRQAALKQ